MPTPASVWTSVQIWDPEQGFLKIRCFDFFSKRSALLVVWWERRAGSAHVHPPPEESSLAGQLQRARASSAAGSLHGRGILQILILQLQILGEKKGTEMRIHKLKPHKALGLAVVLYFGGMGLCCNTSKHRELWVLLLKVRNPSAALPGMRFSWVAA